MKSGRYRFHTTFECRGFQDDIVKASQFKIRVRV